jgi:hypothetical protein
MNLEQLRKISLEIIEEALKKLRNHRHAALFLLALASFTFGGAPAGANEIEIEPDGVRARGAVVTTSGPPPAPAFPRLGGARRDVGGRG